MSDNRRRPHRAAGVALTLLGALVLTGCSPQSENAAAPPATVTVTATAPAASEPGEATSATPTRTPSPEAPACSGLTQDEAFARWVGDVPKGQGFEDSSWVQVPSDAATYDECAALSYIVVIYAGATVSTPNHIMLFHDGTFLGTATAKAYGYTPKVQRLDDASIEVTYRYGLPTDQSNAETSGRAVATFEWDSDSKSVVMTGDVPPE